MNTTEAPFVFQDPLMNSENQTYWAQAQQGKLMLKHWSEVHIGMRVKVNFSASTSGQNVPFFVPA